MRHGLVKTPVFARCSSFQLRELSFLVMNKDSIDQTEADRGGCQIHQHRFSSTVRRVSARRIEELPWPDGVALPARASPEIVSTRIHARGKQFRLQCVPLSVLPFTTGTIFNDSHLPLPKKKVVHGDLLMCDSKKGISSISS
jgi:hypothetical protein